MGAFDKAQKMLLDHNDEFAEVFSVFALKNKIHLDPGHLHEAATEYEHIENSKPEELRRDVVKIYDGFMLGLIVCGLENQMSVDIGMPIRMMGYDFSRYRYQLNHIEHINQNIRIAPVFSHVLNYSYRQKWQWPFSLKDLVNLPAELADFFQDYKIDVTNLAWLAPSQRALLTGDFRILVEVLCEIRETGKITGIAQPVKYIDEMLALFASLTGDEALKNLDISDFKSGETMMCEIWDKWVSQIKAEGFENGEKVGFSNGEKVSAIRACKDFGKTRSETIDYLIEKYNLTQEQASEAMASYW